MRKAVLTGLLACALMPAFSSAKAEAAPADIFLSDNQTNSIFEADILALLEPEVSAQTQQDQAQAEQPIETETKHIVKEGESLVKIAEQYDLEWVQLFNKNLEIENPDFLEVGQELIIPTQDEELESRDLPQPEVQVAVEQSPARPQPVARQAAPNPAPRVATTPGNTYVWGQCTWYVKNRRPSTPNGLGNAYTWVSRAASMGMATGSTPAVGAIAQRNNHVAYVEKVNGDGTIVITEMNYNGGVGVVNTRTVLASSFRYIY